MVKFFTSFAFFAELSCFLLIFMYYVYIILSHKQITVKYVIKYNTCGRFIVQNAE